MARLNRVLIAALALLAVCVPVALADDDGRQTADGEPMVYALSATVHSDSSATLRAVIDPSDDNDRPADEDDDDESDGDGGETSYNFQFGPTPSYGSGTPAVTLHGNGQTTVSYRVNGLSAEKTYQFRAVAWNSDGTRYGPKREFTTLRGASNGSPSNGSDDKGTKGSDDAGPQPALGKTVVAEVAAGTVLVKEQGSTEFIALDAAARIPVNSVLDTSEGTVDLKTARGGGESQTGSFRGGLFQVRQSRSGEGMTEIALRGGDFSACSNGRASLARAIGPRTVRRLWAKDKGGRFKTSGRGSVATVRGTSWYTADRCDGTLTKVSHGAVLVRERGSNRKKLVRHGESFLARLPH